MASVKGIRQMARGVEAQVSLGTPGVPGGFVTLTVTLGTMDKEWLELHDKLQDLFVRRATETLQTVVSEERKQRVS